VRDAQLVAIWFAKLSSSVMSAFTAKRTTFHHKRVINNALGTYSNVSTLELLRLRLLRFHWLWWRLQRRRVN
jgi:hypothetical protein